MSYLDVPAKVLECFVVSQIGEAAWPFDDHTGDPFWQFGATPRDYRWLLTIEVRPQSHSSHKTRAPRRYDGMDVKVGDYVASTRDGTALKIVRIDRKTEDGLVCSVEDVFRYNTFRDVSGLGQGLFDMPAEAMIFEVNDEGLPVVDPLPPSGVGPSFYANLMSRFQTLEKLSNFIVHQPLHGFAVGQLVSADRDDNAFTLTDDEHPYVIGTVSFINGPDDFTVNPIQKVVENLDHLDGDVADILYADPNTAGRLTTTAGTNPVMIKLRNYSNTVVRGTVAGAQTAVGNRLSLNGIDVTLAGPNITALVTAVNLRTSDHGVVASQIGALTIARTIALNLNTRYGEVLMKRPTGGFSAVINGTTVQFTSSVYGVYRYNDPTLATAEDLAMDINRAGIIGLHADVIGAALRITNNLGAGITITAPAPDANGTVFVGSNSITGIVATTVAPAGSFISLRAVDARPINLLNKIGSPVQDFGLYSVENGIKAAAIYIEQGIRTATNYVVPDIASRNSLDTILGDQAYVIDKGDQQWGLFLYTGSTWTMISSAEAAKVDSDTYTVEVTHLSGTVVLGSINTGCKVTSVSYEVITPFNGNSTITVGDDADHLSLSNNDEVDLATPGVYVVTPNYINASGADKTLKVFFITANSSAGLARVSVTYQ